MMADVDSKNSTINPGYTISAPPSTTETRQVGTINRRFIQSPAGILTIVAEILAFCGLISTEALKTQNWWVAGWHSFIFHEFCVVTSWLFVAIFIAAAVFSLDKFFNIKSTVMAYILIVHSAFWTFFLLVSSSCMATNTRYIGYGYSAAQASTAFGFLEMLSLLGVVVSIFAPPFFGRQNTSIF
ncbi:uncharacterized protein LOC129581567 [Paramacrobiotus metropolitanus]|uniref:uncharacterized protein LOC129581567 n=1 Tax=Paramacrobiotus metropolitanus TaxID=2943436 RepID=UPI002445D0C3|nr:uncharacterized protein LOC129581567 [Paramacrobiotus metropolitanus]